MTKKTKGKSFKIPLLPEEYDEPHEIKKKIRQEVREFQKTLIEELTRLITTSFGLMAALAWRGVIQEFINNYLKKFFGQASGLISEIIFALIVTILAVIVTWRLAKIKDRLIEEEEEQEEKN